MAALAAIFFEKFSVVFDFLSGFQIYKIDCLAIIKR